MKTVKCHYRVQSNSDSTRDPCVQHGFAGAVIHDLMMTADSNWQVLKMNRQAGGGGGGGVTAKISVKHYSNTQTKLHYVAE